jgi:hypothetical protein
MTLAGGLGSGEGEAGVREGSVATLAEALTEENGAAERLN